MTVGGVEMLSSVGRIVFALLRFAVGAGLALIGAGLLRQDPRVPAALVHLATQPPFGGLWCALVSLAGGIALMLHALPSPWRTDRIADRGGPVETPEPEPVPPVQRSFEAPAAAPLRWHPPVLDPSPAPGPDLAPRMSLAPTPSVPAESAPVPAAADPAPSEVMAERMPASVDPAPALHSPRAPDAAPVPVFRSRPAPRRPSRARMIGPLPS